MEWERLGRVREGLCVGVGMGMGMDVELWVRGRLGSYDGMR